MALLLCSAQSGRPLGPQTRAQLEILLGHLETALAQIEEGQTRDSLQQSFTSLYARLGNVDEARQKVEAIGEPSSRDFALWNLARRQADAGDFLAARQTAEEIQRPSQRGWALGWVALKQLETGQLNEALATLADIEDPQARSDSMLLVGLALAKRGNWAAAENTLAQAAEAARQMERTEGRAWQLLSVARMQKWAGQEIGLQHTLASAQAAIEQVESADSRDRLRARLAALQTRLGREGESYVTEGAIEEPQHHWEPRAARAAEQAEAGNPADAANIIDTAEAPRSKEEEDARAWALESVVEAHHNAGDFAAAREVINRIPPNHPARAHRLAWMAAAYWWRGRDAEANQAFAEALEAAERVEAPGMKAQALRIVVDNLGPTGQTEQALGVAERIGPEHERRNAFSSLARSQGRRGEFEAPLRWILQVENPDEQAAALVGLAHGLIYFDEHGPPRARRRPQPP
ncbi:MAG: hypothetical protein HYY26_07650 [Acidobacteria bacterium]|nr:hypothetical protein [Acidobacteriota bacterium]